MVCNKQNHHIFKWQVWLLNYATESCHCQFHSFLWLSSMFMVVMFHGKLFQKWFKYYFFLSMHTTHNSLTHIGKKRIPIHDVLYWLICMTLALACCCIVIIVFQELMNISSLNLTLPYLTTLDEYRRVRVTVWYILYLAACTRTSHRVVTFFSSGELSL